MATSLKLRDHVECIALPCRCIGLPCRSSRTFALEWKLSSLGLLAGLSKMFADSSVFFDISFCRQSLTSTFLPVCGSHLKDDLIDPLSS